MICFCVQLDTNNFTLSVSSERLSVIEQLLDQWLTKSTATKSALQSLVNKLVFISKCVRQSRVFIARMLALLGKFQHNHHHTTLTAEFRKDLVWWRRFFREYNGVSMINIAKCTSPDEVFSTDACLAQLRAAAECVMTSISMRFFPPFISEQNLDISSLELLTIIVALKLWGARWTGLRITVRCDNDVAVTVVNSFSFNCSHEGMFMFMFMFIDALQFTLWMCQARNSPKTGPLWLAPRVGKMHQILH